MKNKKIRIIAGPCSVDERNIEEIRQISELKVDGKSAVYGTRVVGIKSRTSYDPTGSGMGMDHDAIIKNMEILRRGGSSKDLVETPSIKIMKEIVKDTEMLVASEILVPKVQLPLLDGKLKGKLMPWSPAVNQLGWNALELAQYSKENDWIVGIKNGKWIGEELLKVEVGNWKGVTSMGKTWVGLADYAKAVTDNVVLIHRGVDVPGKMDTRNAPVHNIARQAKKDSGVAMYFDPSHIYGPKMRDKIVEATIEAMKMKLNDNEYLYDGILIEVGTSETDTEQHITIKELENLLGELSLERELVSPKIKDNSQKVHDLSGSKEKFSMNLGRLKLSIA